MKPARRRVGLGLLVALAATLSWQAVAWACLPVPIVTVLPRSSGPVGTDVTVQGENFSAPVEIRWNTLDGPLLAQASDAAVATPVRIPDSPSGLFLIIMLSRKTDGTVASVARTPFYVDGRPSTIGATSASTGSGSQHTVAWIFAFEALVVLAIWGIVLTPRRVRPRVESVASSGANTGGRPGTG